MKLSAILEINEELESDRIALGACFNIVQINAVC